MDEIKVRVVEFTNRTHYQLRYVDPVTRRKKSKSSGVVRDGSKRARTEAERAAAKWESELREGRYRAPSRISWKEFRERYDTEHLASLAPRTRTKVGELFNMIERLVNPQRLSDLDAGRLSYFQAKVRERGQAEMTIAVNLAHVRSALQWAVNMGMLAAVPKITKPVRAKGSKVMKGRPLNLEEFERMLAVCESIVGHAAAPSWRFYLRGLWASGLRLGESLELYWDRDDRVCVDMEGKRPMLRIPAAMDKGNQTRLLPMSPEFAELLAIVPEDQRTGRVFNPKSKQNQPTLSWYSVCTTVSAIGKRAGIKVNTDAKGKVKFASAHDLRRSFGERWASRVMPQVLMELMRHESIATTLFFYVGRNAERTADLLWQAHERAAGITSGITTDENAKSTG